VTASQNIAQALEPGRSPAVAICLDGVSKAYKLYDRPFDFFKEALTGRSYHRNKVVLSDISLTLRRGEILGIIGRNGAGKSTLLKIIAGTLAPTQGDVTVKGRVAAILELGTGFNPNYSGRDNVILSALMRGMSEEAVKRKFDSIVEFAGLEDVIDEPFLTYSSGMQARLAFAAATAVEADILVIDEALAAGDIRFASRSLRRIHEICQSGVTALFVSHVTYHVMQLCSRVIWIDDGRIRMDGQPVDVVRAYEYEMHQAIARDDGRLVSFEAENAKRHAKAAGIVTASTEMPPSDASGLTEPSPSTAAATAPVSIPVLVTLSPAERVPKSAQDTGGSDVLRNVVSSPRGGMRPTVQTQLLSDTSSKSDPTPDPTQPCHREPGQTATEEPAVEPATTDESQGRVDEKVGRQGGPSHFSTGQYRIGEISFLDGNGHRTQTLRFGDIMRLQVSYECLMPQLPHYSCGLAVAFNRVSDFEAVMYFNTNYPHSDQEMQEYFDMPFRKYRGRIGQIEAVIDPLQLRAGEYYVSLGILPNQPGPHEFYEYAHCQIRITVLANGFDEPSVFYPNVQWTNRPVE
jgi:ABC-type polysaccharide/polyol phosphate transport system ATPase subunit